MDTLIGRLRKIRREVLGLNRRNQEFMIRVNPPPLVGLVDHKARTKKVLTEHGLPVPDTFGSYGRQSQLAELQDEIQRQKDFVLKPARGAGGEGVLVITENSRGQLTKSSGFRLGIRDVVAHAADIIAGAFSLSQTRDEALLERRLIPHPQLSTFSPGGVPDVRVVVVYGVPIAAMVRLPTHASDGRANLHMGGIGVGLSLATGRAIHAILKDKPISMHPDTQQPLSALCIPYWPEILLLAARSYEAVPLGYFGIDVVIDARHGPSILEMNARPGLGIQLATHRGLRPTLAELQRRADAHLDASERVALGREIEAVVAREYR